MSSAASRRTGPRSRHSEPSENDLQSPIHHPPLRPPRSPLISIQEPSRNPPSPSKPSAPRSSPRVSTAIHNPRPPISSVPVPVPHFELNQDLSFWRDHNVQVLIRIRPVNGSETGTQGYKRCLIQESSKTLAWTGHPESRFTFDHVACETISQEKLFVAVGLPMVENCMSGYNSCMFAYGQTGSGKTYTMMGEIGEIGGHEDRGMTPRIFEYLFTRIREEEENNCAEKLKYSCKCSFLEIYNEQITDLLEPSSTNLQLREDLKKGVYVENLKEYEVSSVKDIFELLLRGTANRKIAATHMNTESSRSHSVFTCVIESRWEKDSMAHLRFGRLNLVDLAGSERQKSSGAEGDRLKEAANINKSLSTLGLVIMTLVDIANGKNRHVPYRDSRLTFLLQDSLGGNSKTMVIANISPSICSASETLSTLKFAQRAKLIQNNAKVNEDAPGDVTALQKQIQKLKDRLNFLSEQQIIPRSLYCITQNIEQAHSGDIHNVCNSSLADDPDISDNTILINQKINYLESALTGALRREKIAEAAVRNLENEMKHVTRLVHQREDDTHQIKVILRFREEKLKRLELLADDLITSDDYLKEENAALSAEVQLLKERIERNPELTQFAMENMRLLEQLRMFQNFYQHGERETLLAEISHLCNQFLKHREGRFVVAARGSIQQDGIRREMDSCRRQLDACLEYNAILNREVEDLRCQLDCHQGLTQTNILNGDNDERRIQEIDKHSLVDVQLMQGVLEERVASSESVYGISHIQHNQHIADEDSIHPQLDDALKELRNALLLVKAMESQQIHLIEEIDDLKQENHIYSELLKGEVDNTTQPAQRIDLEHQLFEEHKRMISLNNQDADKLTKHGDAAKVDLLATLEKMHKELEEAKLLNKQFQDDHASHLTCQHETEQVQQQVELETAQTILYLQDELAHFQQEVDSKNSSAASATSQSMLWRTKYEEIHKQSRFLVQENMRLSDLVAARDMEIRASSDKWEKAIVELTNFLVDGCRSLEDAYDCIGNVVDSFPQKNEWINEHVENAVEVFIEKEKLIVTLQKRLEDAHKMGLEMKLKLNSLKGATLAITEGQQLTNDENSKELFHLKESLIEKVSRTQELENILKLREHDNIEAEKNAKLAFGVIKKLHVMSTAEALDVGVVKTMINELVNEIAMNQNKMAIVLDERNVAGCSAKDNCSNEPSLMGNFIQECSSDLLSQTELCQMLQTLEGQQKNVDASSSITKQILFRKLDNAKADANEKSSSLFLKFEEVQETLEEADTLLKALIKANEDAKHGRDWWKQASEELLAEKNALVEQVQQLSSFNVPGAEKCGSPQRQISEFLVDLICIPSSFYKSFKHMQKIIREKLDTICSYAMSLGHESTQCICTSWSRLEGTVSKIMENNFAIFVLYECQLEAFLQQTMQNAHPASHQGMHAENFSLRKLNNICPRDENRVSVEAEDKEKVNNHRIHKFVSLDEITEVQRAYQIVPTDSRKSANYGRAESSSNHGSSQERDVELEKDTFQLISDMNLVTEEINKFAMYLDDYIQELSSHDYGVESTYYPSEKENWEGSFTRFSVLNNTEVPSFASSSDLCNTGTDIIHGNGEGNLKSEVNYASVTRITSELEVLLNDIQHLKNQFSQLVTSQLEINKGCRSPFRQNNLLESLQEWKPMIRSDLAINTEYGNKSIKVLNKLLNNLQVIIDKVHLGLHVKFENRLNRSFFTEVFHGIRCIQDKTYMLSERCSRNAMEQADIVTNSAMLEKELDKKDEIIKGLNFDIRLLRESNSKMKDIEDLNEEMAIALAQVQNELAIKTAKVNDMSVEAKVLESKLQETEAELCSSRLELEQSGSKLFCLSNEITELRFLLKDAYAKNTCYEELLEGKKKAVRSLEREILSNSHVGRNVSSSVADIMDELTRVSNERDHLRVEIAYLNDRVETASALADENEAIAVEARQVAEASKLYAEGKEEEVKVLERSVDELEDTINILEKKVHNMKEEVESYQLIRKGLELQVQNLTERLSPIENAAEVLIAEDSNVEGEIGYIRRRLHDEINELCEAKKRIEDLETENISNRKKIEQYKDHISELVLHSEAQSSQYQEKFKELGVMVLAANSDASTIQLASSVVNKEKTSVRTRGSGSPFRCITNIVHQVNSEKDNELSTAKLRIEELEALAVSKQKELNLLTARLATVENMTHDVIRDLLGVKLDMTQYANLIDQEWLQEQLRKALQQTEETNAKDKEICDLEKQISTLIEERDSWIEEINQRKTDMLAYQVSVEQLKQRDQLLTAHNELLKADKANLHRRIVELDDKLRSIGSESFHAQTLLPVQGNNPPYAGAEELQRRLSRADSLLSQARK